MQCRWGWVNVATLLWGCGTIFQVTRSLWDQEGFIDVDGTWHVWYDNDFCHDGRKGTVRSGTCYVRCSAVRCGTMQL